MNCLKLVILDKKATNDALDKQIDDEPSDSLDYVPPCESQYPGNNTDSEAGEVPTSFDYPDNNTDSTSFNRTDVDPLGRGASLASEVNGSANAVLGNNDYYVDYPAPSEFEDVLDRTLTSAKGTFHVEGKILYAPGDYSWKLLLRIEHDCHNGTTEVIWKSGRNFCDR